MTAPPGGPVPDDMPSPSTLDLIGRLREFIARGLVHLTAEDVFDPQKVARAVKAGMGAGLVALLVGLQPVLTALWISGRGGAVSGRQWAGLALGLAGLIL